MTLHHLDLLTFFTYFLRNHLIEDRFIHLFNKQNKKNLKHKIKMFREKDKQFYFCPGNNASPFLLVINKLDFSSEKAV